MQILPVTLIHHPAHAHKMHQPAKELWKQLWFYCSMIKTPLWIPGNRVPSIWLALLSAWTFGFSCDQAVPVLLGINSGLVVLKVVAQRKLNLVSFPIQMQITLYFTNLSVVNVDHGNSSFIWGRNWSQLLFELWKTLLCERIPQNKQMVFLLIRWEQLLKRRRRKYFCWSQAWESEV